MFEARSQFSVTSSEIAGLSLDQLLEKLDKVAQEIAAAQSQHMFESVNQAVTKVGNVIDAQGGPLSPALFLEMIKKVQIDFDASGKPRMPTVVIHPDQAEKVKALMSQMEASPEIKSQFDRIISIKREEWRAREADRGLAG
jgi:predicted transcriptional regulator